MAEVVPDDLNLEQDGTFFPLTTKDTNSGDMRLQAYGDYHRSATPSTATFCFHKTKDRRWMTLEAMSAAYRDETFKKTSFPADPADFHSLYPPKAYASAARMLSLMGYDEGSVDREKLEDWPSWIAYFATEACERSEGGGRVWFLVEISDDGSDSPSHSLSSLSSKGCDADDEMEI